jgi:hypothetical protein
MPIGEGIPHQVRDEYYSERYHEGHGTKAISLIILISQK